MTCSHFFLICRLGFQNLCYVKLNINIVFIAAMLIGFIHQVYLLKPYSTLVMHK